MLFLAHEYIVLQAMSQVDGLDRRLLPAIVLGVYFPDINKIPISRFFKKNLHVFPNVANPLRSTQRAKACELGWRLHILADLLWHKEIHEPMESPICVYVGLYDPIRQQQMSQIEHAAREIALDLYVRERIGNSAWGTLEKFSLKEVFDGWGVGNEVELWCYKQAITVYIRWFIPSVQVLPKRGIMRRVARNYNFITEEVASSVNILLEKSITTSARDLRKYLEEERKRLRISRARSK